MTSGLARILYVALSIAALGLITTVNRVGAGALRGLAGARLLWLASLCLPSLLACAFVYFAVRPREPLAMVRRGAPRRTLVRLGVIWLTVWLAASAVAALAVGHWIRYTSGFFALTCFVLIGPVQEELLYRGALFELIERGWPDAPAWGPIVGTAVPFALQHFQFHDYRLSAPAVFQVAFTVPMGIVFARLRQLSGSVWPGVMVHVLTNLAGAFGRSAT